MTRNVLLFFRVAAIAEACSWAGLLVGMVFKYLVVHDDLGVKLFGPIHGGLFVLYGVSVLVAARVAGWSVRTTVLGLLASVPPFATLRFERWATARTRVESVADPA